MPSPFVDETPPPAAPPGPEPITNDAGQVAVTNPDGSIGYVRPADVGAAQAQGLHLTTEPEYYRQNTGAIGTTISGIQAAARGATFGLSDKLIVEGARALGDDATASDVAHFLSLAKEAHPGVALGSEVVGSLAGIDAMPAIGLPIEAGEGAGLIARAGARFASALPREAMVGGAIGVGNQLSEDALGDHDSTAQKLLAAGAKGAVFNGLLGGGLAAGFGAVGDIATGAAGRLAGGAEEAALEGGPYRAASLVREADGEASKGGGLLDRLGKLASENAEEQAFKATGAKLGAIERLGATADEQLARVKQIGRRLLDEDVVGPTTGKQEMATRVRAKLAEAGKELGALRKGLDKATVRPSLARIGERFQDEILAPLKDVPLGGVDEIATESGPRLVVRPGSEAAPAMAFVEDMAKKGGGAPDFDTLYKFRRRLDDILEPKRYAKAAAAPPPPGAESLFKLRQIIESEFERAGEEAAKELGDTFQQKYRVAKDRYADLKVASKILGKEAARETLSNRAISLTDTIAGAGGLASAATAIAAGHPVGALAVLAPVVNKGLRTYGNQLAAVALDKAAQFAAIQRANAHVDGLIAKGARSFLTGEKRAVGAAERTTPKVTADDVAKIREVARDPKALTARVADVVGNAGLHASAPSVARALSATLIRAGTYLASRAPSTPAPVGMSFVPQPPRAPAASDMARFQHIVDAVNDPMSVVDDLRRGHLDRDKIEALEVVYPRLYEQLRGEMRKQGAELRPELTSQQEIALSFLFREPLSPQFAALPTFQATYAKQPAPGGPGGPGGGGRSTRERASLASPSDRLENPS